jgi:GTPase SAR1 family protein
MLYAGTDVYFAVYSSCAPGTLANLRHKWLPEIRTHAGPNATVVLVATKTDARGDPEVVAKLAQRELSPVSTAEGAAFAEEHGCACFVECSSVTQDGVREVFEEAVRSGRKTREAATRTARGRKMGLVGRLASALGLRAAV